MKKKNENKEEMIIRIKDKKGKIRWLRSKKNIMLRSIDYQLYDISNSLRYMKEEYDKRNIIPNTNPKEFEFKRISDNVFELKCEFKNDEGDSVGTMYLKGDIWYCLDIVMNMKFYRKDKKYEKEAIDFGNDEKHKND